MSTIQNLSCRFILVSLFMGTNLQLLSCNSTGKKPIEVSDASKNIKSIAVNSFFNFPKPQILLVGTFHFNYPGLDGYKEADKDKMDVLSDLKQNELEELSDYIKRFKPNKIAIEATKEWEATKKLRAYAKGDYRGKRDERFQLAMRIASEMGLDTLYSVDATTLDSELKAHHPDFVEKLWENFDWRGNSKIDSLYGKWYDYNSKQNKELSLLESFKYSNSEESLKYTYGANLAIEDFKLDGYRGADVMSIYWFNRNLRTVRNIQEITESSEDKILVIMGRGHVAMLRQFLDCTPEFNLIDFNSLSGISN